jgi:hypothetical protein
MRESRRQARAAWAGKSPLQHLPAADAKGHRVALRALRLRQRRGSGERRGGMGVGRQMEPSVPSVLRAGGDTAATRKVRKLRKAQPRRRLPTPRSAGRRSVLRARRGLHGPLRKQTGVRLGRESVEGLAASDETAGYRAGQRRDAQGLCGSGREASVATMGRRLRGERDRLAHVGSGMARALSHGSNAHVARGCRRVPHDKRGEPGGRVDGSVA